jgi:hypothetical protein
MYLRVTAPDHVELDGEAGQILFERSTRTGTLVLPDRVVAYRLYGPLGQGYNFGIVDGGEERLTLAYTWRDGVWIYEPSAPGRYISTDGNRVTDGVVTYGEFSYHSSSVSVKLGSIPLPFDRLYVVLLVALDVMFSHRIILFAHR